MKINNCIGAYSVSKTLRFRAIPQGKTQERIVAKRILEEDEERAAKYKKVKKYIDRYHIFFIDDVLQKVSIPEVPEYAILFSKNNKTDSEKERMTELEDKMRKRISDTFKADDRYGKLFKKEMIHELLPVFISEEEELSDISDFSRFTTAFNDFYKNRENMYVADAKSTAISFRCINQNLPKFLMNIKTFQQVREKLSADILDKINMEMNLEPYAVENCFCVEFFDWVLSQRGIDVYNSFLGGKTREDGTKIQGLNEYINLYNQQLAANQRNERIPQLIPLYKQILSDRTSASFYLEGLENDENVINAINTFHNSGELSLVATIDRIEELFDTLNSDTSGIYVKNGVAITDLSNKLTGMWSTIRDCWNVQYDNAYEKKISNYEKYEEQRAKDYKKVEAFSFACIEGLISDVAEDNSAVSVKEFYLKSIKEAKKNIVANYDEFTKNTDMLTESGNKIVTNESYISVLKKYLDAVKEIEGLLKPLLVSYKVEGKDETFYSNFIPLMDRIQEVDSVYNLVRNYVTKKPYSLDKFKLYFENPQLLDGWDKNKESDYRCTLLQKSGKYYLAIIDKADSKVLAKFNEGVVDGEYYEQMNYKLLTGANKMLPKVFFSKSRIEEFNPSKEVLALYKNGSFKKTSSNFKMEDCWKLIDFYKDSIAKHEWSERFDFKFKETKEYQGIDEFYRDVENCGYGISFDKISAEYINSLVDEGKLYLFQLYCKDFSENSNGTPNLHTLYFKMLFDERNISHSIIQLCGGAEFFLRKASLKKENLVVHPKNQPIGNKNPDNPKKESVFEYDIYKDKRYSEDQYMFHVPIKINRNAANKAIKFNDNVRTFLSHSDKNYVIGIDRGERNLLYICVVGEDGTIAEQFSLNEIINEHHGVISKVNYHNLLDVKEKERAAARESWKTIENIKELKEGYISQVVHKICELVVKYDAVIAMEDLNSGFKNSRKKVEKQVYQKFEKMLIDKLNYMVDKQADPLSPGGVLMGYQLTNKFTSFSEMGRQNGFIFYIPAWLTSKIDPATGFVDLLKPKYTSVENAKSLISNFESIRYSEADKAFAFELDYQKFQRTEADYLKKWTLFSHGERIINFRNCEKNNEWDNKTIDLTQEFSSLLSKYKINYKDGADIIDAICKIDDSHFHKEFIYLVKTMLQMRNSVTGNTEIDYLISPVKNGSGIFYDSRNYESAEAAILPQNADSNGAYNIARKVHWAIEQFKDAPAEEIGKVKISISNAEWLEYAQTHRKDG